MIYIIPGVEVASSPILVEGEVFVLGAWLPSHFVLGNHLAGQKCCEKKETYISWVVVPRQVMLIL